jgi:membrane dipeptidase
MSDKPMSNRQIVADLHNHIMVEIAQQRLRGKKAVFQNYFAPRLKESKVNLLVFVVGGDNTALTNGTDFRLWGTLWNLDLLFQEAAESEDTLAICRTYKDIEAAVKAGKIALILAFEGGRPLEGPPHLNNLSLLRTFYRLGVRLILLTTNGRNALADGHGEARTGGGLTNFGVSVVEEMNRLGMIIDVTHISEAGFWDVISVSKTPVIDSHSNTRKVCNHPRNLTDEQIKAIADKGGVIGLSCITSMVSDKKDVPTIEDLLRHVDHIASLVGTDYIGIGPDHFDFEIAKIDLIWNPVPGWLEGIYYGGVRENYFIDDFQSFSGYPKLRAALESGGYSEEDCRKILGENFLRVCREVLV